MSKWRNKLGTEICPQVPHFPRSYHIFGRSSRLVWLIYKYWLYWLPWSFQTDSVLCIRNTKMFRRRRRVSSEILRFRATPVCLWGEGLILFVTEFVNVLQQVGGCGWWYIHAAILKLYMHAAIECRRQNNNLTNFVKNSTFGNFMTIFEPSW